jgi:hypothetical protein
MNGEKVGTYLSREVVIERKKQLLEWANNSMENSALLLYFEYIDKTFIQNLNSLIKKIINLEPLVIAIAGKEKDLIFDLLLQRLSEIETSHHILTKSCEDKDIKNILEDFFMSTWPTEESFDNWQKYSIVFFGKEPSYNLFKEKLKKILDKN